MESSPRILIVDDDADMRQLIGEYLGRARFLADAAADGQAMAAALDRATPDLILLDIMMPGTDGLTLCQQLRANTESAEIPIIMLTARDSALDRVVGLELGADDYLNKPFEPLELVARIKAVLRRSRPRAPARADVAAAPSTLRFGGWALDAQTRQLVSPQGLLISLASSDYRILEHLVRHPRQPVSRDQLMDIAFGRERVAWDRAIDVCVSRLRAHIETDSRRPQFIRTVRHEGYMFTPPQTGEAPVWMATRDAA